MEYEINPEKKFSLGLGELRRFHELVYFFTWRDIKVKYKQTILGLLWVLLQPLIMMLLLTALMRQSTFAKDSQLPYQIFVLSGLILWNLFSNGVSNAGNSIVTNSNMLKKIYFPRIILPLSSITVAAFDFLVSLLLFIGMLFFYRINVNIIHLILSLCAGTLMTLIATTGMGLFLSALNVKYRDFRYIIPFMLQGLLFASPVIYPVHLHSAWLQTIFSINPMFCAIEFSRYGITGTLPDMTYFFISLSSSLFFLILGTVYFRRTESYFADIA